MESIAMINSREIKILFLFYDVLRKIKTNIGKKIQEIELSSERNSHQTARSFQ